MARDCRAPAASSFMALLLVAAAVVVSFLGGGAEARKSSNITVVGSVYCDACANNTFSKHSFFLKGESEAHGLLFPATILFSTPSCSALHSVSVD
uniref:Pollen-specific protein C13 n=1 Tax=Aegilops tauschii subsp. strangulata TaxID=200361 RepID=A0A453L8T9_AEGTS